MICLFCGQDAPVRENWILKSVEGGTVHQVEVINQPICDACWTKIAERAAENDRIRRGPEK